MTEYIRTVAMAVNSNMIIVLFSILILQNVQGLPRLDPLVETNVGLIRGVQATDGEYSMFLGIPYATVDESNPFGPSTPHPSFDSTFEAYDDSAICPQVEEFNNTIVGTLDCLHLNIYVPNTANARNRLAVLVWIYGGGFSIGFAGRHMYGPKYLVRHDVILVTVNYRLGPYGFMCLDIPEVPGNQGLKDQLTALRWIKSNIESFGGDVDKITLFGESAGGMSVDLHLHSDQEMLFNNVIMESGTAMIGGTAGLLGEPEPTAPLRLAEQLGYVTSDVREALSFLATADSRLVIAAASQVNAAYRVCIENDFDNVERFLSDYTINKNIPKARGIPILIGFNSNEMITFYMNEQGVFIDNLNLFNDELTVSFDFDDGKLVEMEEIVRHFYIGDEGLSETAELQMLDFASDITFNHPTERSIARYLDNDAEKVFYYVFSYNGGRNFVKRKNNITAAGAGHADEIGYLFDISLWTEAPATEDQLIIDRMTAMWTNFAKYGDPTPDATDVLPIKWEPITRSSPYHYLDIDSELSVKKRPFNQRMSFWDLFYKSNWEYQKGVSGNGRA